MSGKLEVPELQKCPGSVAVVGALGSFLAFCERLVGCLVGMSAGEMSPDKTLFKKPLLFLCLCVFLLAFCLFV